ncbi:MAG TPA: hypothetical protein VN815_12245 [Steroidobacteraceae bacterium]|jgi:hypothetical protein|nr:hypothetical protein [Steroidobacteraceae bacterium]
MDMASLLKRSANLLMGASLVKLVAGDLVRRSPYGAAGTAAALGLFAGIAFRRRQRRDGSA